jgi:hypothetical protein
MPAMAKARYGRLERADVKDVKNPDVGFFPTQNFSGVVYSQVR